MSNGDIVSVEFENKRELVASGRVVDGTSRRGPRVDNYGDLYVLPGLNPAQAAALSGGYFCGTNATPGTELASSANQTAYAQNLPIATFQNASTERIMIPDVISMKCETVLASATRLLFTLAVSGLAANDYASGGTVLTARNTLVGYSGNPAHGYCVFGAVVVTDVAKTILMNGMVSDVVPVIDSQFIFRFGMSNEASYISGAATASYTVRGLPAVALKPGATCSLYLYGDSGSATPTYEPFMSWYER